MRSSVSAVFFLAMVPLGLMATELQTAGHQASNLQGTAAGETQHRRLAKKKSSRPSVSANADSDDKAKPDSRGRRRYRWKTGDGVFLTAPPPTAEPSTTPPDTAGDMEPLLKLHNEARCRHNAAPLTYSAEVATSAMEHAQVLSSSCGHFYHSQNEARNGFGENLYQCWGTDAASCYRPEAAIDSLYNREVNEGSIADYGGQATQILWKSTTQLGCAVASCTLGSSNYDYLVCHYNPPGNFLGILDQEVELPSSTTC